MDEIFEISDDVKEVIEEVVIGCATVILSAIIKGLSK